MCVQIFTALTHSHIIFVHNKQRSFIMHKIMLQKLLNIEWQEVAIRLTASLIYNKIAKDIVNLPMHNFRRMKMPELFLTDNIWFQDVASSFFLY